MNLSEINAKTLISVPTARCLGTVVGVHISRNTYAVEYIAITNADSLILAATDMYAATDAVSTFGSAQPPQKSVLDDTYLLRLGIEVYDVKGKRLGTLSDYVVDAPYKKQRMLIVGADKYSPSKIVSAGDFLILNTGRQMPLAARTPKIAPTSTLTVEPASPQSAIGTSGTNTATVDSTSQNYSFLLGRLTKRNIADLNGLLLIPSGTVITRRTIETARSGGKLSELAINSR